MYRKLSIVLLLITTLLAPRLGMAQRSVQKVAFDCFGDSLTYQFPSPLVLPTGHPESRESLEAYCRSIPDHSYAGLVQALKTFREEQKLDDWLYYQLVRRVADQLVAKKDDYYLYTIYKWYLLKSSGYDASLAFAGNTLLFYVYCEENIYNIPIRKENGRTYVCLNYHDYGFKVDFEHHRFQTLDIGRTNGSTAFSYKVNSVPHAKQETIVKDLQFTYNAQDYHFRVKLNGSMAAYFKNYPVTDYEKHFNIPLSQEAYQSLIPALRKQLRGLSAKDGVDFLMHFTRYAFLFKTDTENHGRENIYSPELTLLNESSDCEDRVSLFYFLVKEIYDLPMIVLVQPKHVSIGVQFPKSFGQTIEYNGQRFTVCEPTPQGTDLRIGESIPSLAQSGYQVAFAYEPRQHPSRKK